jgi:cell division septation protein DedD
MEDALKARLIGASILVVLAVALLPELLSGPKTPASDASGAKGTRVITIDLGGAVEASRAPRPEADPAPAEPKPALPTLGKPAATSAALADTSEPVAEPADDAGPSASEPVTVPPAVAQGPAPAPGPTKAAPKPAIVAEPAPKPVAGSGKYSVQVGAFSSADGARKLVGDLKAAGFSAYVLAPAPGKKLHRVRVGPVANRAAADQLASKLKSRGLPVAVTADG